MAILYILLIINLLNITQTYIVIKLRRYMPIKEESNTMLLGSFINQRIKNVYTTEIYMGDPSQSIPGFLNMDQYGFILSNSECPHSVFYYKEKSKTFSYSTNKKISNYYKMIDTLSFYSTIDSTNHDIKVNNFEITSDNDLNGAQCFFIGMELLMNSEEKEINIIDELHHRKIINSYFYEYQINDEDEVYLIMGLNEDYENNKKYKFIKPMSIPYSNDIKLKWGLIFQSLHLNNSNLQYDKDIKVELDINCGCILGNSDFKDYFKKFLTNNGIIVEPKKYEEDYYVYFFKKNIKNLDKLENFNIEFYHKELNFNFNYKELILEKNDGYYFLIAFGNDFRNHWKFGFPFFKKYHFIFNHDSKTMGFLFPNEYLDYDINNNNNNDNNNKRNHTKQSNEKIINNSNSFSLKSFLIIFLSILFIIAIILFFGILIGRKIFGARKSKVNELVELYDYKSADKSKAIINQE